MIDVTDMLSALERQLDRKSTMKLVGIMMFTMAMAIIGAAALQETLSLPPRGEECLAPLVYNCKGHPLCQTGCNKKGGKC